MFTTQFQAWVRRLALRVAARLRSLPVTPNQLTVTGLLLTVGAAALIALGHPFYAGLVLLFAGIFDVFDGALARASGRSYAYGAFLDSTTDRFSEAVVMIGLVVYFERHQVLLGPVLVVLATAGSLLVSYVRARAQSLGFTCDGGLLARPERILLTVFGLLMTPVNPTVLLAVVGLLAIFTNFTALQRMWTVWKQSRAQLQRADTDASTAEGSGATPPASPPAEPRLIEREVRPGPEPAGG